MSDPRKAAKYAEQARKHDEAKEFRMAERYYLLAAQELASSTLTSDARHRRMWDQAAKRARRLADLEVSS